MRALIFLISVNSLLLFSCKNDIQKSDIIIYNATIWTGNSNQPKAESFAIKGDSIIAIGNNGDIEKYKGNNTKLINANGKFISPGFIDAHVHLLMGGNSLLNVELRNIKSKEEFTDKISSFTKTLEKGIKLSDKRKRVKTTTSSFDTS